MAPQRHREPRGVEPAGGEERVRVGPGEVPGEGPEGVPGEPRWIQVRFQVGRQTGPGEGAGGPRWAQVSSIWSLSKACPCSYSCYSKC